MSIEQEIFGLLPDGREVKAFTMKNKSGMCARIMTFGGAILELWVPDREGRLADVVGGYDTLSSYVEGGGCQGSLVGRFGNRIADAKFTLDGKEYPLYANNGKNHLHGGRVGFHKRLWSVEDVKDGDEPTLRLSYCSPDGEEGYPGTLKVLVSYTLNEQNGLEIRYEAETDAPTPVNLTNHAYFNLGGCRNGDVLGHILWLDADTYLPTDETMIPTGEFRQVAGTPFDFRSPKPIGRDIGADDLDLRQGNGYDHCMNFVGGATEEPVLRAVLLHEKSGRVMEVFTNQSSAQLYTANSLNNPKYPLKGGFPQVPRSFVCIETQAMPDSPNQASFTDTILREGERYDFTTEYRFSVRS